MCCIKHHKNIEQNGIKSSFLLVWEQYENFNTCLLTTYVIGNQTNKITKIKEITSFDNTIDIAQKIGPKECNT